MTDYPEAWFSTLGAPLGEGEQADIAAYLHGLGIKTALPTLLVGSWSQASALSHKPAEAWWNAEEAERARLEKLARLDPADRGWLASADALHGAAAVAAARGACADPRPDQGRGGRGDLCALPAPARACRRRRGLAPLRAKIRAVLRRPLAAGRLR